MLELTKHQNKVGLVLQEGSRLVSGGSSSAASTHSAASELEQQQHDLVRRRMKQLNDMWESLRTRAVERQAVLHEHLMKLQTEQLNQMDAWLGGAEARINAIAQLADSLAGLAEQKDELARLQDDLVKVFIIKRAACGGKGFRVEYPYLKLKI